MRLRDPIAANASRASAPTETKLAGELAVVLQPPLSAGGASPAGSAIGGLLPPEEEDDVLLSPFVPVEPELDVLEELELELLLDDVPLSVPASAGAAPI